MKKIQIQVVVFLLFFAVITPFGLLAQHGTPFKGKIREIKIYNSGKIEQFFVKAKKRLKAGEQPTARFEVTYNNFSDEAKTAFAQAVEFWSYLIHSQVPIKIDAYWEELDDGVLGSAGANSLRADFKNAPFKNTYYPIALANKLAGFDLEPGYVDIRARFSSSINWYLGTDGNCPALKHDFVTIVMHEIGHGLGFLGSANVEGSMGSWGYNQAPYVFDRFVFNGNDELLIDTQVFDNPSTDLKTQYTSDDVFFQSSLSDAANSGGHTELYAPTIWNEGSSYSHLGEIYNGTSNSMMTYSVGTGEVTHHPGDVTLGMFAEMGWINVLYKHDKVKDMESMTAPVTIETEIYSDSALVDGSVKLHYSIDKFVTDNTVSMSTINDTLFTADIPVVVTDTVWYYFETSTSLNRTYYYPVQGVSPINSIDSVLYFAIGTDNEPPVLGHTVTKKIFNFNKLLKISVHANDNLGLDSVYISYKINDGASVSKRCDSVSYNENEYLFLYETSLSVENLQDGDTIFYTVGAVDISTMKNTKTIPETGFFKTAIFELGTPVQDLTINFDESSHENIFFDEGLIIDQPSGFDSKALHSPHPYEEGDPFPNDEIEYSSMLKTPIVLKETDAYIRFDQIVIVEPGEIGTSFGDSEFWDYVVVEGSKDSARTWFPFESGYDCRISSTFRSSYTNEQNGEEAMYLSKMINLLGNPNLKGKDKVLIRFRLYSDQLSVGWGWAIDNIEIQGNVTSVKNNLIQPGQFTVFPNPSDGIFDIVLNNVDPLKNYVVQIYDSQGHIVYVENKSTSADILKHHIDISGQTKGIYLVKIFFGKMEYVKKIFKF